MKGSNSQVVKFFNPDIERLVGDDLPGDAPGSITKSFPPSLILITNFEWMTKV